MKRVLLASAALLAFTVLSSSASAATSTVLLPFPSLMMGGTSLTTSDQGLPGRVVSGTPQGLPLPSTSLDYMNIEVSCSTTATPDALSTFVRECYLKGTGALGGRYDVPVSGGLPGPADTTVVSAKLSVPAQTYDVCMVARGVFRGGSDRDIIDTNTVCL
jgi:hypothetical protein